MITFAKVRISMELFAFPTHLNFYPQFSRKVTGSSKEWSKMTSFLDIRVCFFEIFACVFSRYSRVFFLDIRVCFF